MNTKYRIWDYDNNAFDYIDLLNIDKTIETFDSIRDYFHADYLRDNPDFIQPCTGLKDTKGKDIYEGDLISLGDNHWDSEGDPDIKEIVFDEDSASFRIYDYMDLQGSSLAEKWYIDDVIDQIEVIGNIHENPELLDPR
ncbi:YopX family protein [Chryseobacterium taichungense]|uniref:YopX family protein n=1 Tax=Chryseobacterium taichungense TaxID=295069 RepID=UPI0028AA2C45|nr:YopX family protein [Chryseobacterium taichungense]